MNKTIIDNWNSVVKEKDEVWHLGDFAFVKNKKDIDFLLQRLHGKIHFIPGNHDRIMREDASRSLFTWELPIVTKKFNGHNITMSHFCMRVWPKSHRNTFHLYGHSHGGLPSIGKSHDVGVDNNNFTPLSLDQIVDIMKSKDDNPNLIKE